MEYGDGIYGISFFFVQSVAAVFYQFKNFICRLQIIFANYIKNTIFSNCNRISIQPRDFHYRS